MIPTITYGDRVRRIRLSQHINVTHEYRWHYMQVVSAA